MFYIFLHNQIRTNSRLLILNFAVLEHRLNCTPFVSPVCLPNPRDEPEIYENVRAVAIGWGTVNVSTGEMPQKLQVIFYEIETLFIQCKALRCTFFREWKNSCRSKFVQLELNT
jgi:hypothetical protein